MGFNENVAERLASASLYLVTARVGDWPAGSDVCAAYFAPYSVTASWLQDAIENRDICVHYQPIVSLANGKIVGAEALARWPQTDGSWLSPDSFIPLAQQTGLSEPLTLLIIRSVFEDMGDWLRQHPQQHISINLESPVLTSEKIPQLLRDMINHYQVNPRQIALELTEREFADPKTSAPIISRYREAGHEIYLDDLVRGIQV